MRFPASPGFTLRIKKARHLAKAGLLKIAIEEIYGTDNANDEVCSGGRRLV